MRSPQRGGDMSARHGRDTGGFNALAPPGRAAPCSAGSPLDSDPADAARPMMRIWRLFPDATLLPFQAQSRWLKEYRNG